MIASMTGSSSGMRISSPWMRPSTVSRIAAGCSNISLSMKCSKPPFSAASIDQSTSVTSRSRGEPSTPVMTTPSACRSATSPSSRKMTRLVWASSAATSDARKLSPSPMPTIRGTLRRAPTRRLGSRLCMTAIA